MFHKVNHNRLTNFEFDSNEKLHETFQSNSEEPKKPA